METRTRNLGIDGFFEEIGLGLNAFPMIQGVLLYGSYNGSNEFIPADIAIVVAGKERDYQAVIRLARPELKQFKKVVVDVMQKYEIEGFLNQLTFSITQFTRARNLATEMGQLEDQVADFYEITTKGFRFNPNYVSWRMSEIERHRSKEEMIKKQVVGNMIEAINKSYKD